MYMLVLVSVEINNKGQEYPRNMCIILFTL